MAAGVDQSSTTREPPALKANIDFDGSQFFITNRDTFDWTSVVIIVNSGLSPGSFRLRHPRVKAGQTYTVGAMQFANRDGQKFNPFTTKAKTIHIFCQTPYGERAYGGGWE